MKKTKLTRSLLAACSIVALTAVMYGCVHDGGDDTTTGDMDMEMPMPTPDPTPDPTAGLYKTAIDVRSTVDDAEDEAAQAVKDATKYSVMLDAFDVNGDSMTAQMNAQMVLDAKDEADQAVEDAKQALADAETAKTEAEALPADNEHRQSIIDALDAAIDAAKDAIDAAEDSAGSAALKTAVQMVTGTDEDDPNDASDVGKDAAMEIGALLMVAHTLGTSVPAPAVMNAVRMDDSPGMTWGMIVGEGNIESMPIGTGNAGMMVSSISGRTPAKVWATVPDDITMLGTDAAADGATFADANYSGIPGTVRCLGTDCKVNTDGELAGGWYFIPTPTSMTELYVTNDDGTGYEADDLYVQFGHWLDLDGGTLGLNTFAARGGTGTSIPALDVNDELDEEAEYSGPAAGMSLHKTTDEDGKVTSIYSGAFTANVNLTAKFGGGPTVSGMIDNFQTESAGANVDSKWEVELASITLGTGSIAGVADGGGDPGTWTAQAYGAAEARPEGIFGGFQAHFSDGHATGAYATTED